MGASGIGSFENDDALDWVGELESDGKRAIQSAFRAVLKAKDSYLEAPECCAAIAAAEVVAALQGHPAKALPDEVREWIEGKKSADAKTIENARAVLERILADSELKELWAETKTFHRWKKCIVELTERLASPPIATARSKNKDVPALLKKKRYRPKIGDVFAIPLETGAFGFGRVLTSPLCAFYDHRSVDFPAIEEIVSKPIAFKVWVHDTLLKNGDWRIIGNVPLTRDLLLVPQFFIQDSINGKFRIYRGGKEKPATRAQCMKLECAAVWAPEHIESRLVDHFAGRSNDWVELMRP